MFGVLRGFWWVLVWGFLGGAGGKWGVCGVFCFLDFFVCFLACRFWVSVFAEFWGGGVCLLYFVAVVCLLVCFWKFSFVGSWL